MTRLFNNKADKIILNKIVSEHNRIYPKAGVCRFNFRCFNNAVHDAIKDNQEQIAMVVYFDSNTPIVHFINYDGEDYIDNTLGEWVTQYEVYLIRYLDKCDFWYVSNLFNSYRAQLRNCLPFWVRWFSNNTF